MHTSEQGIDTLELEEGDVLKAYRDIAGVWTISMGLTAASGVITPKPGMTITRKQSRELTEKALARNYEPAVNAAMPGAAQHEFDAAISFHWNTGAIKKASWVTLWRQKAGRYVISEKFLLWNKAGGKRVPALANRRHRELKILFDAVYPVSNEPKSASIAKARWVIALTGAEKTTILGQFMSIGYDVGTDIARVPAHEVRRFQADHNLTVDGKIGRATVTTLQRMIDARAKAKSTAAATATSSIPAAPTAYNADEIAAAGIDPLWLFLPLGLVALWALWRAWHYRDAIAARIQSRLPKLATFLRSF
ncbi:glycoside hydrolase family protein [uncultured Celeribacter sp.]|uniref:glycoside hydrolase family protein n=1 Tax=uncultured Celeribacter sp. TaxID=1303376 RepID=UPI002AA934C5|nr:peptidoglycan-binding protein [uncultured Celeribacter sp.]